MRKWMRERLQRRKKKPAETSEKSAAAPPPLQPAYFDAEEPTPASSPENVESKISLPHEPEQAEPPDLSMSGTEDQQEPETATSRPGAAGSAQGGRGRRRRGGRGRGGRGREQAVAQAFAPKAIPDPRSGPIEELQPADAELPDSPAIEPHGSSPQPASTPVIPAATAASQRPPKGIVVLAIGLPGSGKSSWFKRHNVVPLSSDMVRSLLFDDVREQRYQDLVFSNLRSMLKARLIARRPMNYVDATNLTPQERQHWVKLAKDYQYEVHAVFFDVPLEVCIERHQRRDRVIPEDVMRRMAAKLKAPAFEEGFAKITVVRVKKKEPAAE